MCETQQCFWFSTKEKDILFAIKRFQNNFFLRNIWCFHSIEYQVLSLRIRSLYLYTIVRHHHRSELTFNSYRVYYSCCL